MNWQEDLQELLNSYFGYQSVPDGVAVMARLGRARADYHTQYLQALDGGIEAALRGDPAVLDIVWDSNATPVEDIQDCLEFLQDLRKSYLQNYTG